MKKPVIYCVRFGQNGGHMNKKVQTVGKLLFVAALIGIIIYTFRDSIGPIMRELGEVSAICVLIVCLMSIGYEMIEGWITWSFAKKYNPQFTYTQAVASAFYCSFYRVATLGSGAGVAGVVYFNAHGIPVFQGTGMYMIEYALHKLSIAIFSGIFFLCNFSFMEKNYGEYGWMLIGGYVITAVITLALILFCCSKRIHGLLQWLLHKVNRKGKLDEKETYFSQQCEIVEEAASKLLHDKKFVVSIIGKNLIKFAFWYGIPFVVLYESHGVTLSQTMAVTSLSVMLAAVIPSPAGIGSTEFVFAALFAVLVGTAEAGSASLLYRFATFLLPFAVGAVVVILQRIENKVQSRSGK